MRNRRQRSLRRQGGWEFLDWANLAVQAYGAYNASQSAKDAKNAAGTASATADQAIAAQTGIALANEGRSEEAWDEYMTDYVPAKREALSLARTPIDPNVEAAAAGADYSLADATRGATMRRNLQKRGISSSSGEAVEAERLNGLAWAAGRAAALTSGRWGEK